MRLACVVGLSGPRLEDNEARFLKDAAPAGLILFARNVENTEQLRRLIGEARDCIGADDALVMIDQEGGRVQRMGPPEWPAYPPARALGIYFEQEPDAAVDATREIVHTICRDLVPAGINTNCIPLADLPVAGAHDVIGHRAFAARQEVVVPLARATIAACLECGVLPVVKHVPGHGRASVDSHEALPIVAEPRDELQRTDFAPFRELADCPIMMTAHVVYTAIDDAAPASTSARVHEEVIRRDIGFDGLLVSDDLSMSALDGAIGARASAVIRAGSDIALHCNGKMPEMEAVAAAVPALAGRSLERLSTACGQIAHAAPAHGDPDRAQAALAKVREIAAKHLSSGE